MAGNEKASAWPIYRERAQDQDADMLETWHETLNVLLIFVSLLS